MITAYVATKAGKYPSPTVLFKQELREWIGTRYVIHAVKIDTLDRQLIQTDQRKVWRQVTGLTSSRRGYRGTARIDKRVCTVVRGRNTPFGIWRVIRSAE